ncbi:uncharacterized protein CLUP02_05782 [Colletotrichum lupini]|uniref:Uncharacterized protein n=1 Tax=Colletotrichum lupini TaxID=145971 RepID=A0A9Q8SMV1_9PEZI|nr:uncharacterized protein CLUP02_05782 [Colletotrichum lupini]UQC80299.1 hypothetical protein CLUP02_05782 [Colletotrichum lupini]
MAKHVSLLANTVMAPSEHVLRCSTLEEWMNFCFDGSGIVVAMYVTTTGDDWANNAEASIAKVGDNGKGERGLLNEMEVYKDRRITLDERREE